MRDSPITAYNINTSADAGVYPSEQPLYERVYLSPGGLAPSQGDYFKLVKTHTPFGFEGKNLDYLPICNFRSLCTVISTEKL